MKKNKILVGCMMLICGILLFSACGKDEAEKPLDIVQMVSYQNDNFGYEIQIPENWQVQSEDDKAQIYAVSGDNKLALNVICELGGFNYYTPQDLAETIAEKTTASFTDTKIVSEKEISKFPDSYRVVVNGKDENGIHTVVDVSLLQPIEGIHYYLIFSGGVDDYQSFLSQWEQMLDSFKTTKTAEEMYQKLVVD